MLNRERLARAAKGFEDAALGKVPWQAAVDEFSSALDLRAGQLVAFGHQSLVSLNISCGFTPAPVEEVQEVHHPSVNSRVRIGSAVGELEVIDERSFTTRDDMRRSPAYAAWMERNGVGYSCVTPLLRQGSNLVGLAAFRGSAQSEFGDQERRAFAALAARARAAVTTAISLEADHASSLVLGMDNVASASFVCNGMGQVIAASPAAEQIFASGRFGRLTAGSFLPANVAERGLFNASLAQAINARLRLDMPPPRPMVLKSQDGDRLVIEFVPLMQDLLFALSSSVLLIFRGARDNSAIRAEIARALFALTTAETRVAADLLRGLSPTQIAEDSGISVGTIRSHVHRILSKSHCTSQMQFVAEVNRLSV